MSTRLAGAAVRFGKKKGTGESKSLAGAREFMEVHAIEIIGLNLNGCIRTMEDFIRKNPRIWNEDIGEL